MLARTTIRRLGGLLLAVTVTHLVGCVRSVRTDYARHLAVTHAPGPAATNELSLAFGLDGRPSMAARRLERGRGATETQ